MPALPRWARGQILGLIDQISTDGAGLVCHDGSVESLLLLLRKFMVIKQLIIVDIANTVGYLYITLSRAHNLSRITLRSSLLSSFPMYRLAHLAYGEAGPS